MKSSHGGAGWRPRTRSHRDELGLDFGVNSEVGRLEEVLLAWPPDTLAEIEDPADHLMSWKPDLDRMRQQCETLVAFYELMGVKVHLLEVPEATPNLVFMRDLFLMTPEGAFVSRMASEQRAGEEMHVASALTDLGIPILATPRGTTTFEGSADALWAEEQMLFVGVGKRTNAEAVHLLTTHLLHQEITVESVWMPPAMMHLQSFVQIVDRQRAVVLKHEGDYIVKEQLERHGFEVIPFAPTRETEWGMSLNFVQLGPNEVVMPAMNDATRDELEASGVTVHEVDFDEYAKADGGIGCATGILKRARL